jgi:hypothetical protein
VSKASSVLKFDRLDPDHLLISFEELGTEDQMLPSERRSEDATQELGLSGQAESATFLSGL